MFSMFSTKKVKKEMPRRCEMTEKEIDDMLSRSTQRTKTFQHSDDVFERAHQNYIISTLPKAPTHRPVTMKQIQNLTKRAGRKSRKTKRKTKYNRK
jgi:hypothetical protein